MGYEIDFLAVERGEKSGEAGECSAERDVTKNTEWRNVVLQFQEQQPIEQSASGNGSYEL